MLSPLILLKEVPCYFLARVKIPVVYSAFSDNILWVISLHPGRLCHCTCEWGYIFFSGVVEQYLLNVFCMVILLFPSYLVRHSSLLLGPMLFVPIGISRLLPSPAHPGVDESLRVTITSFFVSWSAWLVCFLLCTF